MPELPEVETLRSHLDGQIIGYRILRVKIFKQRIVRTEPPSKLENALQGRRILGIQRRGKYLIAKLGPKSKPLEVLIHLGMTGRLTEKHLFLPRMPNLMISFPHSFVWGNWKGVCPTAECHPKGITPRKGQCISLHQKSKVLSTPEAISLVRLE